MMDIREYVKTLEGTYSYWEIDGGKAFPLNNISPKDTNIYIIFRCMTCGGDNESGYHAIFYRDLKKANNGDYLVCCPNSKDKYDYETWLDGNYIPTELQGVFNTTKFEVYKELEDDDEDFIEDDDSEN